ncbi:MAG: hypothetical protein V1846_05260, partial [Candidatus Komeilibacteria bacterium]
MKILIFVSVICFGLMCLGSEASAELLATDWPAFKRNFARNGINEEASPLHFPLQERWRQFVSPNENFVVESSPLIVDGKVFIGQINNSGSNPTFNDKLY